MNIGHKIKRIREQNKLSQEELASLLDIKQQQISEYESGQTEPRISKLEKIAKIFNVSLSYFINEDLELERPCFIQKKCENHSINQINLTINLNNPSDSETLSGILNQIFNKKKVQLFENENIQD